jgi:hypothetical protein
MATFNSPTDVTAGSLAKSSDVNNLDAAVVAAFALLPANAKINAGTVNFAVDTGAANAYLVALPQTASSYSDGLSVVMRPLNSNTGACTINVDSLGVVSIKTEANGTPSASDIVAGVPIDLRYSSITGCFHLIRNSAQVATAAAASAAAALGSQNAAAVSAAAALVSQGAASVSAAAALVSQNAAAHSEAESLLSESAAALSAAGAFTFQNNASASASGASTSASTATTQAGNASTSAAAALVSELAAAASYDSFDDRYLGAKASDPTLDNDGNALLTGALYFNTVSNLMKVYSGTAWNVLGASEVAGDGIDVTFAGGQVTIAVDLKANGGLVIESTELALDLGASAITGILAVGDGGTGRSTSTTAYGLIAAGETPTGTHQTLAAGAVNEILVGGGVSALPVWTTATGTGSPVRATDNTQTILKQLFTAATELTIATGEITATQSAHLVDTESDAAADDLVTISGGAGGQLIAIRAVHTDRTVVVKHGTGNILTDGADISLNSTNKYLLLLYDGVLSKWIVVGGSGSGGGASKNLHQDAHGLSVGDLVYLNSTVYTKAKADADGTAEVVGIVSEVSGTDDFTLVTNGWVGGLTGFTAGTVYFLSDASAGLLTATEPTDVGHISKPCLIADTTTSGYFFNMRGATVAAVTDPVSNDAYGAGWDGINDVAPSKNAVYDQLEAHKAVQTSVHGLAITASKTLTVSQNVNLDEAVALSSIHPWIIDISPFHVSGSNVGWATVAADGSHLWSGYCYNTGHNQNDEITWPIMLAAGTWTFELCYDKNTSNGIISVQLDGVEKGTIDTYASSGIVNNFTAIAGIVIATTGKYTLKLKVTDKHASSSNYYGMIQHVRLIRTA